MPTPFPTDPYVEAAIKQYETIKHWSPARKQLLFVWILCIRVPWALLRVQYLRLRTWFWYGYLPYEGSRQQCKRKWVEFERKVRRRMIREANKAQEL